MCELAWRISHESEWNFFYKSQDSGKFIKQNLQTFTGEICYFPATWIELICSFIIQTLLYFTMAWLGCTRVNFYNMKKSALISSKKIVIKIQWFIEFIIKTAWMEINEHLRVEQASGKRM